jgi:hypothetical protein
MARLGDNSYHTIRGLLSRDWIVFVVVSALLVGLVFEISLVRVSGFESVHDVHISVEIFTALEIFCLISQLIILNFVHKKIGKFVSVNKSHIDIIHKAIVLTQLGIIALLLVVLYEITLTSTYHLVLLKAIFLSSFLTATCIMALLSSRFIIWLKSDRSRLTLAYLLASSSLSLSATIGIVYVLDQMAYYPEVVRPKPFGEFVTHYEVGDSSLANAYTISSATAFILLWLGTVFLLQSYRKRLGAIKYWIIMSVPLLYFLSQFEPLVLNVLFSSSLANPTLFSIFYTITVNLSTPLGGVLFGLSFVQIARKVQHPQVKSYMVISAIGLLLLLVSYQAQVLITAPFPPFGLLSVSFMGLSSYLIFTGIYSSAVSVSQDSTLRTSIRRSVETEVEFIGNIGGAQMDHTILEKVLKTTKIVSKTMPQDTGIAPSLTEDEIAEYIKQVLRETRGLKDDSKLSSQ